MFAVVLADMLHEHLATARRGKYPAAPTSVKISHISVFFFLYSPAPILYNKLIKQVMEVRIE